MEAERSSPTQTQGPSTPSASTASKEAAAANTPPAIAEVSPGERAFSPPNDDAMQDHDDGEGGGAVGFGPPPAFPSRDETVRKRKREHTLMAVSTNSGGGVSGAPLEDDSEEEDNDSSGNGGKTRQSQMIHRIKAVPGSDDIAKSPDMAQDEDGAKKYSDAMLLASLSDVDSPKKQEETASGNVPPVKLDSEGIIGQEQNRSSPKSTSPSENSSNAHTPLRSNVNPNPLPVDTVKPFALMPRQPPNSFSHKRGKFGEHVIKPQPVPAPHSPDGRDPKAARPKNEKGAREGIYAPHPQQPGAVPPGAYPPGSYPGYHPGYPYPYSHPGQAPPPHHASGHPGGHPAYPPGYPYMSAYGHYSQGAPGMAASPYPHHPGAYYPGQHPQAPQAHPSAAPTSSTPGRGQGPIPAERWGTYHSPKGQKPNTNTRPEPVRSNPEQPPYHPLSASQSNKSHVVPSEYGDAPGAEGVYGRPPPTPYGAGPPPPGYMPDSRYRPAQRGDGYYGAGPQPVEYNAISRDEGTPPRIVSSPPRSHGPGHPGAVEYSPQVGTPPRSSHGQGYDYYEQGPPGSHHGAYPPPTPDSQGGYHPDSPPRSSAASSSYAHHPGYGPPPTAHDPYEPFDYAATSPPSSDAHYHVPASVSNETEPSSHHPGHPGAAHSPASAGGLPKYHQFRKGGRSLHSEPIILRKKFSWRNYPELEEYLIANRTDYLRHSALNYTAEQKHFNNRLTEGLLEMAAKLNYVFDETCFNFVAVRDRIRCYYKSYVQSSKKRGVVVGFSKSGAKKEDTATC